MPKKILALDPGKTTGWAEADEFGVLRDYGEALSGHEVANLIRNVQPAVVILESFRLFPSKATAQIGSDFPAVEIIGVVKLLQSEVDFELIIQTPQQKKFFMPVQRLLCYGYDIRRSEHARDAARHLLYYFVFKQKVLNLPQETEDGEVCRVRRDDNRRGHDDTGANQSEVLDL